MDGHTGPVADLDATAHHRTHPPRRHGPRRRVQVVTALLAALVALLCSACGSTGPSPREDTMDPQAELAARPTLDEMIARYDQMLQRIRDRLDTELGPFAWYEADPRSWGTCGPTFPFQLGGRTTTSPLWAFPGNIPDDQWPRAARIVADITAEYGFVTAGLRIDTPATPGTPGHHVAGGVDPALDAHYDFSTKVNSSIQVYSGCHRSTDPTPQAPSTGIPARP